MGRGRLGVRWSAGDARRRLSIQLEQSRDVLDKEVGESSQIKSATEILIIVGRLVLIGHNHLELLVWEIPADLAIFKCFAPQRRVRG